MLNIFINTWGNYNENGADGGEWISLPMEENELNETLEQIAKNMGDEDPEFCIHDFEWITECGDLCEVDENMDIFALNEQLQEFDTLNEWEQEETAAAVEAFGYTFKEAMEKQQRGCFTFYKGYDLEDLAYELADEYMNGNSIPSFLSNYFDYKAFARDLGFDGYTETTNGVIIEG